MGVFSPPFNFLSRLSLFYSERRKEKSHANLSLRSTFGASAYSHITISCRAVTVATGMACEHLPGQRTQPAACIRPRPIQAPPPGAPASPSPIVWLWSMSWGGRKEQETRMAWAMGQPHCWLLLRRGVRGWLSLCMHWKHQPCNFAETKRALSTGRKYKPSCATLCI